MMDIVLISEYTRLLGVHSTFDIFHIWFYYNLREIALNKNTNVVREIDAAPVVAGVDAGVVVGGSVGGVSIVVGGSVGPIVVSSSIKSS